MPVPILLISDAPDTQTGLGRITRDLAFVLSEMPEFRVGTFGRGGLGSKSLPWAQYLFPESEQWGENLLIKACEDFSPNVPFIIFTIWDASRLFWFGHPDTLPEGYPLKSFLLSNQFQRWGYFPIDAYGPNKGFSSISSAALDRFDRMLAYSKFGRDVLSATRDNWCPDFIPHGIDQDTFINMEDRSTGRLFLNVDMEAKLVGCVMTNQARKDWGLWAHIAKNLINKDPKYMFWVHIDALERYWSLPALIEDFGIGKHVRVTQALTDNELAVLYNACDITMLPSLGEGFGYPIAESLACGTPVVHHDYGAGHEMIEFGEIVHADIFRLDTLHNVYRPVFYPEVWASKIQYALSKQYNREEVRASVEHLFWNNLAPVWKNWFKQGLT